MGRNVYGALGVTRPEQELDEFVEVPGLRGVAEIAAAGMSTCARWPDGRVECWGMPMTGRRGGRDPGERFGPAPVAGVEPAAQLAPGYSAMLALRKDGSVVRWGSQASDTYEKPTPIPGLRDAIQVSNGREHGCAVQRSGKVACWGNASGPARLAMGGPAPAGAWQTVSGLNEAVEVAASATHTCARRRGGTVVCWGVAELGELGIGGGRAQLAPR